MFHYFQEIILLNFKAGQPNSGKAGILQKTLKWNQPFDSNIRNYNPIPIYILKNEIKLKKKVLQ